MVVVAWYALLAMVITWPLPLHLTTALPANPTELSQDLWQNAWNMWWVREAVVERFTNPYTTDMLFYPHGASLFLHTLNLPLGVVAIPLFPLIGLTATYNLLTLGVLIGVGYGSFLLAHHLVAPEAVRHRWVAYGAAVVAGTLVICSPLRLNELRLAQLPTLSDYGLPFALLATLIAVERWQHERQIWGRDGKAVAVIGAAVALAICGLSSWYHLFHAAILLFLLWMWRMVGAGREQGWKGVRRESGIWLAIAVTTTVLLSPVVIPTAIEALSTRGIWKSETLLFHADLASLLPKTFGGVWQSVGPTWRYPEAFAWTTVVLAGGGIVFACRRVAMWATIALTLILLSLGTHLPLGDSSLPLPYVLFRSLPMLDVFRAPGRLNGVTTLILAIIAAYGIVALAVRLPRVARGGVVGGAVVFVVIEVVRLPFPIVEPHISPFYHSLGQEDGTWSILELPINRPDRRLLEMYAQTIHEKPILTGQTSRGVTRLPYESAAPIAQVEEGRIEEHDIVTMPRPDEFLRGLRVRYLLIHRDPYAPERMDTQTTAAREAFGPLTTVYSTTTLRAYQLDDMAAWLDGEGKHTRGEVPLFVGIRSGRNPLEQGEYGGARWLHPKGLSLWIYSPTACHIVIDVKLYSFPGARPLEMWLNGDRIATLPIPAGLTPRHYQSGPYAIEAGANTLDLVAPAGGVSAQDLGVGDDPRPLSFSIHHVGVERVGARP
jgi:hypothetical protein